MLIALAVFLLLVGMGAVGLRTLLARQPSQTFVLPEQVGALAAFLASDAAASITGANYTIDGGWTAQ